MYWDRGEHRNVMRGERAREGRVPVRLRLVRVAVLCANSAMHCLKLVGLPARAVCVRIVSPFARDIGDAVDVAPVVIRPVRIGICAITLTHF